MRKLVVSEFVSLDGVIEAPGPDGSSYVKAGWTMPYGGEDFMKFKSEELFASSTLLLGHTTYRGFAEAWPTRAPDPFTDRMNTMEKVIVSNTLTAPDWQNSKVISNDISNAIATLKAEDGADILVFGSAQLVQYLASNNLVDEYRLLTYPVVLGSGKKLFVDGIDLTLALTELRTLDNSLALLVYRPEARG